MEREWGRREDIMQRTGLRLLEGWEAGRLLERNRESVGGANGDSSRIPGERRRTTIQQKGPWVLGETVASTN